MEENRYKPAGWVAIIMAVLFPLGFFIGFVQGIIGAAKFHWKGPTLGPADIIFIVFTVLAIYVLVMFRRLINEKYNFHEINTLITVVIWWNIITQVLGITLKIYLLFLAPLSELAMSLIMLSFVVIMMLSGGTIDILIAVKLMKIKDSVSDVLRVYIYLTLATGIMMVSLILSPLALLLAPVSSVLLAIIFFKEKEQVEFV